MKVCLAQINTTPGDFGGNLVRIKKGICQANSKKADIAIFPELSIPGYLTQDLMYHPDYVHKNLVALQKIVEYSVNFPELHVVVGYIDKNYKGARKPFRNMAGIINKGTIVATYQKHLLPFYDVFDELRYFEPGTQLCVINIKDRKVGITICEDVWNDKGSDDYNYTVNPLGRYRDFGVNTIISINSSPYIQGKAQQRTSKLLKSSEKGMTIVYVNQIGGQDELVFDGQSFIAKNGELIYVSKTIFADSFNIFDLDAPNPQPVILKPHSLYDMLTLGLRDYILKSGFKQVVVGSSGGVDSALVLMLACDAIGPKNVHAIRMPSCYSSDASKGDAFFLHNNLGCHDYLVPIDHMPMLEMLNTAFKKSKTYNTIADQNIQARLRDVYIMHFSNAFGVLPLATGNKSESACGYFTHFDMNLGFAPIKDLYKHQIHEIVKADKRCPTNIWKKPPSAELAANQEDESVLLPYEYLDPIVEAHVESYISTFDGFKTWVEDRTGLFGVCPVKEWLDQEGSEQQYTRIIKLMGKMEFKRRQTCPGVKVTKVAFGIGRRIPIVEKWNR